ncbi:hypothetical protein Anas_09802 [Armadillidium nasatum]|uniref:Uncharacterized protein n=1 Tax=Armadillidium nasatum TaxID=96803 RepID=A0A5N5T2S9_9CRUS|nr:hypothetical protein Anas_09802 [Armadillidium nasatum]
MITTLICFNLIGHYLWVKVFKNLLLLLYLNEVICYTYNSTFLLVLWWAKAGGLTNLPFIHNNDVNILSIS